MAIELEEMGPFICLVVNGTEDQLVTLVFFCCCWFFSQWMPTTGNSFRKLGFSAVYILLFKNNSVPLA